MNAQQAREKANDKQQELIRIQLRDVQHEINMQADRGFYESSVLKFQNPKLLDETRRWLEGRGFKLYPLGEGRYKIKW